MDNEVSGRWHKTQEAPGFAALAPGGYAATSQVSCPTAGNCLVVGYYPGAPPSQQLTPFQIAEHNGIWGRAQPIPGLRAPAIWNGPFVLSCSSVGNCAISAPRILDTGRQAWRRVFVNSEINGKWGKLEQVPGQARLGGAAFTVTTISCASPGNCAVAGTYQLRVSSNVGGYVASETKGVWGAAKQIARAPASANFQVTAISCASAGSCGLIGNYDAPVGEKGPETPFVVSQVNGMWASAEPVPGLAALDAGNGAATGALSCPAPGECTAVGYYYASHTVHHNVSDQQAFVVSEANGIWGTAEEIPGIITALHAHGTATLDALSCSSAGNCNAGGAFSAKAPHAPQAYTVTQTGDTWHTAQQVPGIKALNPNVQRQTYVAYLSCPPAGPCGAAGYYPGPGYAPDGQIFVLG